jgi:type I pantothenate kinase
LSSSPPYLHLTRAEWARHEAAAPPTLTDEDRAALLCAGALGEQVSLEEVESVYLPLARRLQRAVAAAGRRPFLLGVAGSVAVGKTTFCRVLAALLACGADHPSVREISTDCFLYPNRVLEERGLMLRKGFPESYDEPRLLSFLSDLRQGKKEVTAPVYSHLVYDIVSGEETVMRRPDIVIVEGLHVLAPAASAFLDFSIFVDADERHLEAWYVARFLSLRAAALGDPSSYFRRFIEMSIEETSALARHVWAGINSINLREHILPTRERAHLILQKGESHAVLGARLR